MSQDEVKKVKLKVKCRAIDESELLFDKTDKVSSLVKTKIEAKFQHLVDVTSTKTK